MHLLLSRNESNTNLSENLRESLSKSLAKTDSSNPLESAMEPLYSQQHPLRRTGSKVKDLQTGLCAVWCIECVVCDVWCTMVCVVCGEV